MSGISGPDLDRIRADLAAAPQNLADWQATCLEHMAALLDSLEIARGEWNSLGTRLAGVQERLAEVTAERDRLRDADRQLGEERAALERVRRERDAARRERDALAATGARVEEQQTELADLRAQLAAAQEEARRHEGLERELAAAREALEQTRLRLRDAERAREELRLTRESLTVLQGQLSAARHELASAAELQTAIDDARRELEEERSRRESVEAELAGAARTADALRRRAEQLEKQGEEQLVLICDLRARLNRIETERDEEVRHARRKVKRVLGRIHEALDEAGAPRGEDLSFGERIRRWVGPARTEAPPLPLDEDPFDEFDDQLGGSPGL